MLFKIDTTEEAYKLLNPVVSKLDKNKASAVERQLAVDRDMETDEDDDKKSEDEDMADSDGSSDDDDAQTWTKEVKQTHKNLQIEKKMAERQAKAERLTEKVRRVTAKQQAIQQLQQHAFNEVDNDNDSRQADNRKKRKASKQSLEDRLKAEDVGSLVKSESGHTFTFNLEKSK